MPEPSSGFFSIHYSNEKEVVKRYEGLYLISSIFTKNKVNSLRFGFSSGLPLLANFKSMISPFIIVLI